MILMELSMCIVVTLYVKNIFYDSVHLHLTTLLTSIHLLKVPILHNKKSLMGC